MTTEMESLKGRLKATWMAGDYGHFAKYLEPSALEFMARLPIQPGARLLDRIRGDVNAGHLSTSARGGNGYLARAASHVEHARPSLYGKTRQELQRARFQILCKVPVVSGHPGGFETGLKRFHLRRHYHSSVPPCRATEHVPSRMCHQEKGGALLPGLLLLTA